MQFVEEITRGRMQIGPASMYTIIKKLLNAELIEAMDGDGKKKNYRITNKGRSILTGDVKRRQAMVEDACAILDMEGSR
jgi:DNA-binding PadR family transcriptional regulator